jgi:hypothetical protein
MYELEVLQPQCNEWKIVRQSYRMFRVVPSCRQSIMGDEFAWSVDTKIYERRNFTKKISFRIILINRTRCSLRDYRGLDGFRKCSRVYTKQKKLLQCWLFSNHTTKNLTIWSWALTERPLDSFPEFHGTWRFNTQFTRALHLFLSWARAIQSTSPYPTSPRFILILSTHLRLGLPSGLYPLWLSHK